MVKKQESRWERQIICWWIVLATVGFFVVLMAVIIQNSQLVECQQEITKFRTIDPCTDCSNCINQHPQPEEEMCVKDRCLVNCQNKYYKGSVPIMPTKPPYEVVYCTETFCEEQPHECIECMNCLDAYNEVFRFNYGHHSEFYMFEYLCLTRDNAIRMGKDDLICWHNKSCAEAAK